MKGDALDPKGLIQEAYRIDGIDYADCRTIFLDWALSIGASEDHRENVSSLLERYENTEENHPMTAVLREGLAQSDAPKRRGGARARRG
ncbi:MAG: hypothetical protein AAF066_07245 [Pseudomonadota bacterium]